MFASPRHYRSSLPCDADTDPPRLASFRAFVQGDLLGLADQVPQFLSLSRPRRPSLLPMHQLVRPALVGRRQAPKSDALHLEGDQPGERHLADLTDQAGDRQVQPLERLVVLDKAIETLQVDTQAPLFKPPLQFRHAHSTLAEHVPELKNAWTIACAPLPKRIIAGRWSTLNTGLADIGDRGARSSV